MKKAIETFFTALGMIIFTTLIIGLTFGEVQTKGVGTLAVATITVWAVLNQNSIVTWIKKQYIKYK